MKFPLAHMPECGTPAERFDMAFRKVLTVPKENAHAGRDKAETRTGKEADWEEVELRDVEK